MTKNACCTLLILTYKGKHHLEFLLPTIHQACVNCPEVTFEVLIIDNGSDEITRAYVNESFPTFKYAFSPVNDYLFSLNKFVASIQTGYVFILNDDMRLHPDVLCNSLGIIIQDPELFAVTCKIRDWDDTFTASGIRKLDYKRGWMRSYYEAEGDSNLYYTLYAGGGAAVFRTDLYNQLNGFDPLYRPAYCEDTDLGHRAWHQGFKIVYQPQAVLFHREGGTIKDQFKADKLEQKVRRNQVLWMVRNGNSRFFLVVFLLLLPYRLLFGWRIQKNSYFALWQSLMRLPLALYKRFMDKSAIIHDEQLIQILGKPYEIYTKK